MNVLTSDDDTGAAFCSALAVAVAEGAPGEAPAARAAREFPKSAAAFKAAGPAVREALLGDALLPDFGLAKNFVFGVRVGMATGLSAGQGCALAVKFLPAAHAAWLKAGQPGF